MSNVSPIPPPPKDGYVGVLTDVQKKQLAAFRLSVTAKDSTLKQGDDHEACRFLRSEKWDVEKTTTKYVNYLIWRRDNKIDDFPRVQHPRHDFYQKLIPHGCHGFDKAGRPIYIEKSGLVDATAICTLCPLDEAYLAHAWMQEYLAERCIEQSTKLERHIETFTTILDLKGCNSSHRKALKFTMKFASNDQNYYPERMGSVFIVNAPWIFPVLWNIVKVVLDANTRSKVHVIKGDYKAYLLQHIDADQLPPEYGGECKTCPTSPDCIRVHDITELKANLAKEEEAMELQTVNIPAGKKFEHKVQAAAGAMFGWYFKVNGKDIGFSVEWIPKDKEAEYKDKKPTERNWAEPYARHAADEIAIQGEYTTTEACTVIFTWDNTYSYWSSKEISFSVSEAEIEEDEKSPSQPTVVDTITSGTSMMSVNDDEKAQTKPRSDSTDSDAGGVSFHQE